jgi:hypothetical protein
VLSAPLNKEMFTPGVFITDEGRCVF